MFTNPDHPGQTYLFGGWGIIGPTGAASIGYGNELWRFDVEKTYFRDGVSSDGQTVFELIGQYDRYFDYVSADLMPSGRCHPIVWQDCDSDMTQGCEPGFVYIYGGKSADGKK